MADFSHRPGWWTASDGSWHPPGHADSKWVAGLEAEYRAWRMLRDRLSDDEMVFSDRRLPDSPSSVVDHVVVASSGVWLVDAKKWRAMWYRAAEAGGEGGRLYCGTRDVTHHVDWVGRCALLATGLLKDPSVPVRPAMAVLPEQCRLQTGLRLRFGPPIRHGGVLIAPPRSLAELIRRPGVLGRGQILRIGHRLDEMLPSAQR